MICQNCGEEVRFLTRQLTETIKVGGDLGISISQEVVSETIFHECGQEFSATSRTTGALVAVKETVGAR